MKLIHSCQRQGVSKPGTARSIPGFAFIQKYITTHKKTVNHQLIRKFVQKCIIKHFSCIIKHFSCNIYNDRTIF